MKMLLRSGVLVAAVLFHVVARASELQPSWPEFRGPSGDGHANPASGASIAGLPLHWSETENIKWKTPLPYRGWSTPVIMAGQVWVTTATEDGHDFYAIC